MTHLKTNNQTKKEQKQTKKEQTKKKELRNKAAESMPPTSWDFGPILGNLESNLHIYAQ